MAQSTTPSTSRQTPVPGKPVVQNFPTPNLADRILICRLDTRLGGYSVPDKGAAYDGVDAGKFEGFKFATARPSDQVGWMDLFYVNQRLNQDEYNFSIEYPWVSNEYPRVTRTYVDLRTDLAQPEAGKADSKYTELQLVDYRVTRLEDPVLDSLFIGLTVVFERLSASVGFVSERMESVLPYNMRVAVPGETVSSVEAGVAGQPTLTFGDWRVEEKAITAFKKTVDRLRRNLPAEGKTLVGTKLTRDKQTATVTAKWIEGDQSFTPSVTLIEAEVENVGDGSTIKTETTVPSLFPARKFSVEISDPFPAEFRDVVPTRTLGETIEGEAQFPELAPNELAASEEQLDELAKRVTRTDRDRTALPITRHDYELGGIQTHGSEFGGVLDTARTIADTALDVEQGFDIIASKVQNLGQGFSFRKTTRLATGGLGTGPYLELTDGGEGYVDDPAVVFSGGDRGSGASATATISEVIIPPPADPIIVNLNYGFNGDEKGVFFFLGKLGGNGVWRNPQTNGDITISAPNDTLDYGTLDEIVDREPSNVYFVRRENGELRIDLGEGRALKIAEFTYRQRAFYGSSCTEFLFQGSNDNDNWVSQHTDVSGEANAWWHKRTLPNLTEAYRYFRIILPAGKDFLSIGELELYGHLTVAPPVIVVPTGSGVTGVVVNNGGQNYAVAPTVSLIGDGTGATATAVINDVGVVARVDVTNPGQDYTAPPTVVFTVPGGGAGATATAARTGTAVSALAVVNGGSGYDQPPIVKIVSASGSGARGTAALTGGVVTSITLDAGGTGYLRDPTVILYPVGSPEADAEIGFPISAISVDNGGTGYNSPPVAHVIGDGTSAQTQTILGFPVAAVLIDNGGDDYSSPPTPVFSGDGDFAAGTTTLGHRVASVIITNGGANYFTVPVISVSHGNAQFAALVGRPLLNISMSTFGSGFTSDPAVVITGDGTGAAAHVVRGFTIDAIPVGAGGSGYVTAPSVVIPPPTGANGHQATAHAVLTADAVTSIVIDDPGFGYLTAPTITLTGGSGTGATATATLSYAGSINAVVLDSAGVNYSIAPSISFTGGGGGTGAVAQAALNTAVAGPIVAVSILNTGSGYTTAPTLSVLPGTTGGSGATVTAALSVGGQVIGVTMTNNGAGYTFASGVTFVGGGGSGAHGLEVLAPTGSVKSVVVLNAGTGFRSGAEVEFIGGGGTGAHATVTSETCGHVVSLTLVSPGGPFTVAPLVSFVGGLDTGSAAGFVSTTSMNEIRYDHTATLLPDGRVLAAGGDASGFTSELYDPVTEIWTPTGALVNDTSGARAVLLSTGKVLIVGDNNGHSKAAELYDIAAGTWALTDPLIVVQETPTLTLLADGRALVMGGGGAGGKAAAMFDPTTEFWSYAVAGDAFQTRVQHTATLLPDGQVLLVGGAASLTTAELFEPATGGTWTVTGSTAQPHKLHAAVSLPDGRVLVCGCYDEGETAGKSAEIYDPATGLWTSAASMNTPRSYHTASPLPDGTILVCGGYDPVLGQPIAGAEIYDPVADTWTLVVESARWAHQAVVLADGRVMVNGGQDAVDQTDTVEIYSFGGGCASRTAAAIYHLGSSWPVLIEEQTDPTEGIIIQITKKIVPVRTPLPAGYADSFPLDIYRSIQIVSKVNLHSLPPPDVYHTSQSVAFPSQLLAVTPIWDQNTSHSVSENAGVTSGSVAATVSVHGSIVVLKRGGFRGAAIGRVERQFYYGPPPEAAVPYPTIIQPTSGTAILHGSSNSAGLSGTTLTRPLNQAGQPANIGDLMPGSTPGAPIIFAGYGIPPTASSNSGSNGASTQVVDIGDVLTAGMEVNSTFSAGQSSGAGGLSVAAVANGSFIVSIPASTPAILVPGMSVLAQVVVEKWRFGLFVRHLVNIAVPAVTQ